MKTLALTLIALGMAGATPATAQIVNGNFEAGLTGWTLQPSPGYEMTAVAGEAGGQALRLARVAPEPSGPNAFGAAYQLFDATPYHGQRVTIGFRAHAVKPGRQVGLALRVDRPPGQPRGAFANNAERPIRDPDWQAREVTVVVAPDALRLYVGLVVSGDGDASFDDVTLTADSSPPSAEALAYLDTALGLLKANHYRTARADWPKITADAYAAAVGAKTPADTYPAIRGAITTLGERHTFLATPTMARGQGPDAAMPTVSRSGSVGVARMPRLANARGDPHGIATKYTEILASGIAAEDKAGACGWIIDLRADSGGNMWPMLGGLTTLLGEPPFGWFLRADGRASPWGLTEGKPLAGRMQPAPDPPGPRQKAERPIAVLFGPNTGSAGEMAVVALIGRDRVRSFGQPTSGMSTPNSAFPLPDGASLAITTGRVRDRTGFQYEGPILPDETTTLEAAEPAALRWLSDQGCKAAS